MLNRDLLLLSGLRVGAADGVLVEGFSCVKISAIWGIAWLDWQLAPGVLAGGDI